MNEPNILIVDDEEAIRKSLSAYFDDYGFVVTAVESAEEAEQVLTRRPFFLAVVDLRLPGISGDQFILKVHGLYPGVNYVIHTGSVDFSLTEELRMLGLEDRHVLSKPQHDLSVFLDLIQEFQGAG